MYQQTKSWSDFVDYEILADSQHYSKEQFLLFPTIFSIYLQLQESNSSFVKYGCSIYFSSILQIWYVKVQISQSISESPMDWDNKSRLNLG